jgi:hypothetical protein
MVFQRVSWFIKRDVFGKNNGQIFLRNRYSPTRLTINNWNGASPIALTGYAPVFETKLGDGLS